MYDTIIIGAGVAGYSAAIYAARSKMKTLVIGGEIGGTTAKAYEIENYPGFTKILGTELARKIKEHVESLKVEIKPDMVKSIEKKENHFVINASVAGNLETKTIVLATGTKHRRLGVAGEKEFEGKGVSYCATCDGFFFRNKTIAIVGGGDSAATAALFLSEICEKVYLVFRKNDMRAEPFWVDKLKQNPKVIFKAMCHVVKISGEAKVEFLELEKCGDQAGEENEKISVDGVFIQIGADPDNMLAENLNIEMDERKFIKVKQDQSTSLAGVFAAGDNTNASNGFEQIVTAVSEGAIAANSAFMYLQKNG